MTIKNQVQLITYPDSLGGDLKNLNKILQKYFIDIFKGGIHILPPFPSSGDRGFAPLTYLEIEPQFGTWEDIRAIGEKFDVMLHLMVNHISSQSEFFQEFLKKGRKSSYSDLFIPIYKIWKDSHPPQEDLSKIFLRRLEPYSSFTIEETGQVEKVWTTFGKQTPSEQIDLDVTSQATRQLFEKFIVHFSKQNVKFVRLDAIGYVIKKPGTTCFFVEPEIYQFLDWITNLADSCQIKLLPEVHSQCSTQNKLAKHGYWIYDFILPYTVLETLLFKSSKRLCKYLNNRPSKQFTMLDCHDGIPVKPDLDELVETQDAQRLVDICLERGANLSRIFSAKHRDKDGFDVHQIRCSYYSMLNCNDDAYIAARAIQFFVPGIPQVYYVGLLAGKNDVENIKKSGDGREINRHNYSMDEFESEIQKEVVQRLLKLIKFRNEYPAFNGEFEVLDLPDDKVGLSWHLSKSSINSDKDKSCTLTIDLNSYYAVINYLDDKSGKEVVYEL